MLVNMKEALKEAEEKGYAIGCINTPNMETLRTVVDTVEELNVLIITDYAQIHDPLIPMESVDPEMVECAKQAKAPVCVHPDRGSGYSLVMRAIYCDFPSIMYDLSALPFKENVTKLRELTRIAHDLGITVEAELSITTSAEEDSHGGSIGWTHESIKKTSANPQQIAEFVRETGVDALVVCFGTAHGIYAELPLLDIERVKAIRAAVPKETRVVMHGGSGADEEQVCATIIAGCSKVNYYSHMVIATNRHTQEHLNERDGEVFWYEVEEESYRFMKEYAEGVLIVFKNGKQHRG